MKNALLVLGLCFVLHAQASIDASDRDRASESEVSNSRACFQELEQEGCGDPGVDPQHFRSCMSAAYVRLSKDCQELMTTLYGKK